MASYRKLKLLSPPFGRDLRVLAMTCVHFDQAQICSQVNASFSLVGHLTQVDAIWSHYCFPWYGGRVQGCTEMAFWQMFPAPLEMFLFLQNKLSPLFRTTSVLVEYELTALKYGVNQSARNLAHFQGLSP